MTASPALAMPPLAIRASVIIVSRHRPADLLRCLAGVAQMDHPDFEVIVVADPAACVQVEALGLALKITPFDAENISAARNLGLMRAAGEVVAFLDDDAVPEPSWLSRLVAPFGDARVLAATGFVRGRNGIGLQWTAMAVDALGRDQPLMVDPRAVSLHPGQAGRAVKTIGTNCAFRRAALLRLGGFDPAFRFYLDEADVNLRMAEHPLAAGGLTAVVPLAQVHHGYAQSSRRRADRVPRTLHEIGASSMVFLRRHAGSGGHGAAIDHLRQDQRARALRHMVAGLIGPGEVGRLLRTLEAGLAEGLARPLEPPPALASGDEPFLPLPRTGPRRGRVIAGRSWQGAACRAQAREAAVRGEIVTLFLFSPTALFHHHGFHADGYWIQRGGLFGRAERREPLFRLTRFATRLARETGRLAVFRPMAAPDQPGP